ncbi:MAG: aminopeptidase [Spirochaetaceae bacterium]|jgi:predicted aminopeptidase|nr:aminopeptidase [Spirochaetaceae bacterium]
MMKFMYLPYAASAALIALFLMLFPSCYTMKQGMTFLGYLNRSVPLEKIGESGNVERVGIFVAEVNRIRDFAMGTLGLKQSKNYTRYVDLDRDYLAAIVSACSPVAFERHTWWFPVVGRVPYKGFFNVEDARKESAKLRKKGLDVWVRPVDAFSTLGFFRDPLYSYMTDYPVHRLADLIIHELVHATIYIKSDSAFNESLAEFIGKEGARRYIETYYGLDSGQYRAIDAGNADNKAFVEFAQLIIKALDAVYTDGALSHEEKLARKAAVIAGAQEDFAARYDSLFETENYRGFSTMQINNAYLDLYRLYNEEDSYFEDIYNSMGRDLPAFIAAAKTWKGKNRIAD